MESVSDDMVLFSSGGQIKGKRAYLREQPRGTAEWQQNCIRARHSADEKIRQKPTSQMKTTGKRESLQMTCQWHHLSSHV